MVVEDKRGTEESKLSPLARDLFALLRHRSEVERRVVYDALVARLSAAPTSERPARILDALRSAWPTSGVRPPGATTTPGEIACPTRARHLTRLRCARPSSPGAPHAPRWASRCLRLGPRSEPSHLAEPARDRLEALPPPPRGAARPRTARCSPPHRARRASRQFPKPGRRPLESGEAGCPWRSSSSA